MIKLVLVSMDAEKTGLNEIKQEVPPAVKGRTQAESAPRSRPPYSRAFFVPVSPFIHPITANSIQHGKKRKPLIRLINQALPRASGHAKLKG